MFNPKRARPPPTFEQVTGSQAQPVKSAPGGIRTPNLLIRSDRLTVNNPAKTCTYTTVPVTSPQVRDLQSLIGAPRRIVRTCR